MIKLFLTFLILVGCQKKEKIQHATIKVVNGSVSEEMYFTGRAESLRQTSLIAPEDITVLKLEVNNGQVVREGEVLCRLDTIRIKETIKYETQKLAGIDTQIKTSKIRLEGLLKDVQKTKKLFESGAVSLDEKDKIVQDLAIQNTQLEALYTERENSEKQLKEYDVQKNILDLKSPFDGTVTYVWITKDTFIPGSSVKKGDLLFKISSEGKMIVKTTIREQDVSSINPGALVDIFSSSLQGQGVMGLVTLVDNSATIDKDTGVASFRLYVEFVPPKGLKPGMEVQISYLKNKKENVLSIPKSAVNPFGGDIQGYDVILIKEDKKIKQKIKLGLIGDSSVEVVSGLKLGDEILVNYEQ